MRGYTGIPTCRSLEAPWRLLSARYAYLLDGGVFRRASLPEQLVALNQTRGPDCASGTHLTDEFRLY